MVLANGISHAVTFPAEIKSRMKIKIRKTIKSKIKSKSTTHSAGSWSNHCSMEDVMFRLSLNLNRTPNLLPNLNLHPTLNRSPRGSRDQKHRWLAPLKWLIN